VSPDGEYELPQNGVYAARIIISGFEKPLKCVLNQGKHPTLPEGDPTIEAFILDFSGDIYGVDVTVEYVEFIRGEVRFPDIEALKMQIARDVETARNILA
jgi:riboflavin kinase/FMN adenylyltransferase